MVQRAESLMGLDLSTFSLFFARRPHAAGHRRRAPIPVLVWTFLAWAAFSAWRPRKSMVTAPVLLRRNHRAFVAGFDAGGLAPATAGIDVTLGATWVLLAVLVAGTGGRGGSAGFASPRGVWPGSHTAGRSRPISGPAVWPDPLVFHYGTAPGREARRGRRRVAAGVAGIGLGLGPPRRPALGFLGIAFFVLLAPSSSILPIATEPMAEHRMYLAVAPVVALAAVGLLALLSDVIPGQLRRFGGVRPADGPRS